MQVADAACAAPRRAVRCSSLGRVDDARRRGGMVHVLRSGMRNILLGCMLCAFALAACDTRKIPTIAGLGTEVGASTGTPSSNTPSLTVIPSRAHLIVGGSIQLFTNAPAGLESQVQWRSTQPAIAAVTPAGLVTALGTGTAVIVARYSFDTTVVATTTIVVTGP